jgi:hypothetical protein
MPNEHPLKINFCPLADLSNPCSTSQVGMWEQGRGKMILCKFQTKEKFLIPHCKFFIFTFEKANMTLVIQRVSGVRCQEKEKERAKAET